MPFFTDLSFLERLELDKLAIGLGTVLITVIAIRYYVVKRRPPKLLKDPKNKYKVKLVEKKQLSHDTARFRFGLPSEHHTLGLPIGQHIYLTATINGGIVIRPYTPVTNEEDKGYFDLVVKIYRKDVHPKFPEGGKMSQYLDNLDIGDSILIRGPAGRLVYLGGGKFSIKHENSRTPEIHEFKRVGMIAGGTGITPMFQLIKYCLDKPEEPLSFSLIYANQTEEDILLKNELHHYSEAYPDKFTVYYTVDRPSKNWSHGVGFVNADMMRGNLPSPDAKDSLILLCGPPPMINYACKPNLEALGYNSELVFAY